MIHAQRAEHLIEANYVHPITGASFTLIPPDMLFNFGEIIGKIAASHHWDIKTVERVFQRSLTPWAEYPHWTVDALKLAFILRAADACAIDERRARIMPFVIENPRGISRSHWVFQALLKPGHVARDDNVLVFECEFRRNPATNSDLMSAAIPI